MYFESVQALIEMDGHGSFVLPAYAITIVVVAGMLFMPGRRRRQVVRQIAGEIRRERAQQRSSPVAEEDQG